MHRELVYRHIAWLNALRTQLRRLKKWEHLGSADDRSRDLFQTRDQSPERLRALIAPLLGEAETEGLMKQKNQATQLLANQSARLRELHAVGRIDDFRHMALARLIEEFYTLQGKCERIKNFPLPRQYATVNHWFVVFFIALIPLAMLNAFEPSGPHDQAHWLTVPTSVLLSWVFHIWNKVQDVSENPFEGLVNDIPMDALSRTIEIDMREMLGETALPEPVGEVDPNVLM